MILTLKGNQGTLTAQSSVPLTKKYNLDLAKVRYFSQSSVAFKCSKRSKKNPDTQAACKYIQHAFEYQVKDEILTLTYDDPEVCLFDRVVDIYERL